jgi:hypothetical protein
LRKHIGCAQHQANSDNEWNKKLFHGFIVFFWLAIG